ncbi:MAG: GDP-mannose 4,6-dehydratase [Bryobacterales bacterium]|nr:GDP-mannose 4,6-dehydratase [Bryobacterales bacterium]
MEKKRALITGVNGQDGSYLAELLLARGYEVFGLVRRVGLEAPEHRLGRLLPLLDRIQLQPASLESYAGIFNAVAKIRPDECYHLAAASFVSYEFDDEFSTLTTNINGTHYLLASLKDLVPSCRFYFAGTSEMFGSAEEMPQNEHTRFRPRSIYGISKVAGFELVRNYRERYGMHASSGILFNHESPRRGHEFVTRKITSGVARILAGQANELRLGNLDAERDWGFAQEYVDAMWRMLRQPEPDDYVIATGRLHSVRDFVRIAFASAGLDWEKYVVTDPNFFRSGESVALCGDASKARRILGWEPRKGFEEMVREMVAADCESMGVELPAAAG